jgi:hypothetical protein
MINNRARKRSNLGLFYNIPKESKKYLERILSNLGF